MAYTEEGKRRYTPLNQLEKRKIDKVGVVLLVVNTHNGKVWAIEEQKIKRSTGKINGQIGVPAETRKRGELICDNVYRALTEEMGIDKNPSVQNNFYFIDGVSYKGRYKFIAPEKEVHADVVMLIYDGGSQDNFQPQAGEFGVDEVSPIGWMGLEDLQKNEAVRPGLQYILKAAVGDGWVTDLLDNWNKCELGEEKQARQLFKNYVVENNQTIKVDVGED